MRVTSGLAGTQGDIIILALLSEPGLRIEAVMRITVRSFRFREKRFAIADPS